MGKQYNAREKRRRKTRYIKRKRAKTRKEISERKSS